MKKLISILVFCITITTQTCEYAPLFQNNVSSEPLNKLLALTHITHNNSLSSIVDATQKAQTDGGWLRKSKTERWQIEEIHTDKKNECLPLFKQLGMVNAASPTQKNYDYVLLHGGPVNIVRLRLAYLVFKCLNNDLQFKHLIVLTGKRALDPSIENIKTLYASTESILPFKATWHPTKTFPQTETEMIQLVLEQSITPGNWDTVTTTFIDTPASITYRPTTADTIAYWLKEYHPEAGSILAISNQPHVPYQHEILTSIIPPTFYTETVGPALEQDTKLAIMFDALARWLYQKQQNNVSSLRAKL
ncbi:MAG TPA: hypothetical protein PLU71_03755 [Candidatus Dependentiae bacterium]|nr:hypothetical protein [Candidatus Dependentiae bacterium]HRQ62947.1 hypothetical protein [Candidatus Dependentiae bacterium]